MMVNWLKFKRTESHEARLVYKDNNTVNTFGATNKKKEILKRQSLKKKIYK